jgi:hypothetical protein
MNTKKPETRAEKFYQESITLLKKSKIPFLIGGTFAVVAYTDIERETKDVDFFCKASDYPKILNYFTDLGYKTQIKDERWIAKVYKGTSFFDVIFSSTNGVTSVNDDWISKSQKAKIYGMDVNILSPTELVWSKAFIANRTRHDGGDIAHVILKKGKDIDWDRLLAYFDQYWEVLLIHILNFRFIYPSERELIPRKIIDELLNRIQEQIKLPTHHTKICRGRLFSLTDYRIDVEKWGFADIIGEAHEPESKK